MVSKEELKEKVIPPRHNAEITVKSQDQFELPDNSTHCKIIAKENSIVILGNNCSKIEIITAQGSEVFMRQHCTEIKLTGPAECTYDHTCTVIQDNSKELRNVIDKEKESEVKSLLEQTFTMLVKHVEAKLVGSTKPDELRFETTKEALEIFNVLIFRNPFNETLEDSLKLYKPTISGLLKSSLLKIHEQFNNPTKSISEKTVKNECTTMFRNKLRTLLNEFLENELNEQYVQASHQLIEGVVPFIYKQFNKDKERLESLFNDFVFKTPLITDVCRSAKVYFSDDQCYEVLQLIHKVYNNPSVMKGETVNSPKVLAYREEIKQYFQKQIKDFPSKPVVQPAPVRVNNAYRNVNVYNESQGVSVMNGQCFINGVPVSDIAGMNPANLGFVMSGFNGNVFAPTMTTTTVTYGNHVAGGRQSTSESVYRVGIGETFNLPTNSKKCRVIGSAGSNITIGYRSSDISVEAGPGGTIAIYDECNNINIMDRGGVIVKPSGHYTKNVFVNGSKIM